MIPGGFAEYPTEAELKNLRQRLIDLQPDLDATVQTVLSVAHKVPSFERQTEYMALSSDKEYAVYDGVIPDLGLILATGGLSILTLVIGWLFFSSRADEFAYRV